MPPIRVVVLESDRDILNRVVRRLESADLHLVARASPDDALDYVRRARPEVVLLGADFWGADWARRFSHASPETVVFPILDAPPLALRPERGVA